jgi:hypothetical protein
MCFVVNKTTLELERMILTTLYLVGAKNTDSWHVRKGDLQRAFPLDVSMVPSFTLAVAANGECLTGGGFSLSETVRLGSFEFITDYFGGLSLSPKRGNSGVAFMGSTRSRTPSPRQAIIEDSTNEFLIVSSREGGSSLPSPRRRTTRASATPITPTPWMENASATQATATVPPQTMASRPDTGLHFEQQHAH